MVASEEVCPVGVPPPNSTPRFPQAHPPLGTATRRIEFAYWGVRERPQDRVPRLGDEGRLCASRQPDPGEQPLSSLDLPLGSAVLYHYQCLHLAVLRRPVTADADQVRRRLLGRFDYPAFERRRISCLGSTSSLFTPVRLSRWDALSWHTTRVTTRIQVSAEGSGRSSCHSSCSPTTSPASGATPQSPHPGLPPSRVPRPRWAEDPE